MTLPNHVVGGLFITGIMSAFLGFSILHPAGILLTIFASVLPDIDHPVSPVGKIIPPFSRWLNRRFGHRNLTHSAFCLIVLGLIFAVIENAISTRTTFAKIFMVGYGSHILLDMITLHGVGLFQPFMPNMAVLPGRDDFRIRTGNPRTESVFFGVFIIGFIVCLPFMKQGFWTSYNRSFGTPKHLTSEFHKSDDALLVDWKVKLGSEDETGQGICIDASKERVILLDEKLGWFKIFQANKDVIISVIPTHTGRTIHFRNITFLGVSADSLNSLLVGKYLTSVNFKGTRKFWYNGEAISKVNQQYIINPSVREITEKREVKEFDFSTNPRILTLEKRIAKLERDRANEERKAAERLASIEQLRIEVSNETDLIRRESLTKDLNASLAQVRPVSDYSSKLLETRNELRELRTGDANERNQKRIEYDIELENSRVKPVEFTGVLNYVEIGKLK